ncbi:hypothetical protein [Sinorhizobium medicae]|uniref:hypothetical protein n=1 Tax=Sinorhizobium medicae TaxID=110321 RepID=UPI001FB1BB7C|nr:hypothetical protein [Sinorhizobium medicae]
MSAITVQHVRAAAKGKVNESILASVLVALEKYGDRFGMDRPHRLAQYFAQLMHESGDFHYDREIWGPTPAQHAETITKKINGGKNGLADRLDRLARMSLVLFEYRADNGLQF